MLFASDLRADQLTSLPTFHPFASNVANDWLLMNDLDYSNTRLKNLLFFSSLVLFFSVFFAFVQRESPFKGPVTKAYIRYPNVCIQYVLGLCMRWTFCSQSRVRIRDTQQMCFTERKEPLIYHAYLKTINFARENDSRKMPCNWTISKALAKSARRNELRRSFVRKNRDFIKETACLSWL